MRMAGLLMALVVTLAACGGDAAVTTSAPATTPVPATTAAPAPTTAAPTTTTEAADSDSEWCRLSRAINDSPALDNLGSVAPEQTEAEMDEFLGLLEQASQVAPEEIAGSVETSLTAFQTLFGALQQYDYNVIDLFDDPEALATIDDPAAQAAGDAISAYNETSCGIPNDDSDDDNSALTDLIDSGGITAVFVAQLVENGFTEDEAQCISENLDLGELLTGPDEAAITAVTLQCVSLERLEDLSGG